MLIDSHCHIHDRGTYNYAFSRQQIGKKLLKKYPDLPHEIEDFTPEKIIARAHAVSVNKMICIGTSHEDSLTARDFVAKYAKDGVFWSYGIHPDEASMTTSTSEDLRRRRESRIGSSPVTTGRATGASEVLLSCSPSSLVAIGEVGLDYRNGTANRTAQLKLFERMLQLAEDNDLPLIFHVRDAFDDFFAILKNFPNTRGVVHSFSDSPENLKKSLDQNFYIGINGLATFAPEIPLPPLERALLETDAPFLTPAPFRGTINEPARVQDVCAYLSKVTGESEAKIAEITTKNAEQLFKI
ncbi:TatD family hydrolase [Candidatus Saccharibacteria bacterium]|nr:TatD family hydrolase [Candidatus Saccharibacteria bacterium]MBR0415911.1 TatD family hydrolase [Candidatus Saccharibacteria bacterium]